MQVFLEAIKFNHEPSSATADAFNIRKNESEVVNVPEWRRGISVKPEDSPAAYAGDELKGRTPTIKAKFSFVDFDASIQSIRIRAVDDRLTPRKNSKELLKQLFELATPVLRDALSDNVLGSVMERAVKINGGQEFELFDLENVRIHSSGVTACDIIWRWQFRAGSSDWIDFATTTHRIHTVLAMPNQPWEPNSTEASNTQVPWSEALDYACRWAASALNIDEAATSVTHRVNGLGGKLVTYQGSPTSYARINFDCSSFLKLLRDGKGIGQTVNCYDCAAIVSTFANLLGCNLSQSRMGFGIETNPIQLIGRNDWVSRTFKEHEVAWEGSGRAQDELFDACLHLDGDDKPSEVPPKVALLPTNLPFGLPQEEQYRFRLTTGNCFPVGDIKRRKLGPNPAGTRPEATNEALTFLKQHYKFEEWHNKLISSKASKSNLVSSTIYFDGWKLESSSESDPNNPLYSLQMLWQRVGQSNPNFVRLEVFTCTLSSEVPQLLLLLLGEFHILDVRRLAAPVFGDVVFVEAEDLAVLFAKANHVALIQSVGRNPVSVMDIATQLARFI